MNNVFSSSRRRNGGTGLIEVIVASSILVLIIVGVSSVYRLLVRSSREVIRGTQSALLAEEGLEAARVMRDTAWSSLASSTVGTSYTLAWTGGTWKATTTPALIDGVFDRRMTLARVYRNSSDEIAASGTLDPNTYRVDITVSWNTGFATSSRTESTYFGNIFE
jgi:Tfp pilus assembly protein PilV